MTDTERALPHRESFETQNGDPFDIVIGGDGVGWVEFQTEDLPLFLALNATDLRCMLADVERQEAKHG